MYQKLFIVVLIISVPIFLNILVSIETPYTTGDSGTWLSFFGSYLGAIIGGIVAYYIAKMQFKRLDSKEGEKRGLRQYPLLLEVRSELLRIKNELNTLELKMDEHKEFNDQLEIHLKSLEPHIWKSVKEIEYIKLMKDLFEIKNFYQKLQAITALKLQPLYNEAFELEQYLTGLESTKSYAESEGGSLLKKDEINLEKGWLEYETLNNKINEIKKRKDEVFNEYTDNNFYKAVNEIINYIEEKIRNIESNKR